MRIPPSPNAISRTGFPDVAGLGESKPEKVDAILSEELRAAGIEVHTWEMSRELSGEPYTAVIGSLYRWSFRRAWSYWVVEGPGLTPDAAMLLRSQFGSHMRAKGKHDCLSRLQSRRGFALGLYHVVTAEGLAALSEAIRVASEREERAFEALIVQTLRADQDPNHPPKLDEKKLAALDSLGPNLIENLLVRERQSNEKET